MKHSYRNLLGLVMGTVVLTVGTSCACNTTTPRFLTLIVMVVLMVGASLVRLRIVLRHARELVASEATSSDALVIVTLKSADAEIRSRKAVEDARLNVVIAMGMVYFACGMSLIALVGCAA
jgi:intracellular sulfur oxidation DsrE/DsrF family protein